MLTTKVVAHELSVDEDVVIFWCAIEKMYSIPRTSRLGIVYSIPEESLRLFLGYHPYFLLRGDEEMDDCRRNQCSARNETYTISEIGDIFDVPIKEVKQWIKDGKIKCVNRNRVFPITKKSKVPVIGLIAFIHSDKFYYDYLSAKQSILMQKEDLQNEPKVRHLLMLYMYYKSNGYLI